MALQLILQAHMCRTKAPQICPFSLHCLFACFNFEYKLLDYLLKTETLCWCPPTDQGKYLEQRAPQKPSSLHQIILTAPKLQERDLFKIHIPHNCHGRHGRCPCKFFLPGVIFSRLNAKNLPFYSII